MVEGFEGDGDGVVVMGRDWGDGFRVVMIGENDGVGEKMGWIRGCVGGV